MVAWAAGEWYLCTPARQTADEQGAERNGASCSARTNLKCVAKCECQVLSFMPHTSGTFSHRREPAIVDFTSEPDSSLSEMEMAVASFTPGLGLFCSERAFPRGIARPAACTRGASRASGGRWTWVLSVPAGCARLIESATAPSEHARSRPPAPTHNCGSGARVAGF